MVPGRDPHDPVVPGARWCSPDGARYSLLPSATERCLLPVGGAQWCLVVCGAWCPMSSRDVQCLVVTGALWCLAGMPGAQWYLVPSGVQCPVPDAWQEYLVPSGAWWPVEVTGVW